MKKILLATTCLALTATASMAADLGAAYTKAPMAPQTFSWTGCYAGAHVGGGGLTTNGASNVDGFGPDVGNQNANGSGAVAGGQLGCNYQDGNWVFGLEGEGYWSGIKSNQSVTSLVDSGTVVDSLTIKNTSDFTIAARAGMAFDRTLVYGKFGWAWGNYNLSGAHQFTDGFTESAFAKGTLDGFMVGAGIEHALTRNWTIKAEYDYIGFGSKSLANNFCSTGNACVLDGGTTTSISSNKQLFKVGFNYLFGPGH